MKSTYFSMQNLNPIRCHNIQLLISIIFFSFMAMPRAVRAQPQPADGTYSKGCQFYNNEDYLASEIEVHAGKWIFTHKAYEDEACQTPYLEYRRYFKIFLVGSNGDINLTHEKVTYRPLSKETAEALNLIKWCGAANWTALKEIEVTGKICEDFYTPKKGDVIYTIYSVQNSHLLMGKPTTTYDGSTEDLRHREFDQNPYLKYFLFNSWK